MEYNIESCNIWGIVLTVWLFLHELKWLTSFQMLCLKRHYLQ